MAQPRAPVRFAEATGIVPVRLRITQAIMALRGERGVPPSRFDLSSLVQLRPRLGVPMWRGRAPIPRTVLVTNLFNHEPTPIAQGWSVRKRQVCDFRGRDLTYDSHNGTDLAVPIGTTVLTPAEGRVVRIASEFNRGGLKIFIDHGAGLMTCSAHLARTLVAVGERVHRGQPVALSGYSGLDGFITFPWGVPHVHFNVWLDGTPVDPFARPGEASMWRAGDRPTPPPPRAAPDAYTAARYDHDRVQRAIAACTEPSVRERLRAERPLWRQAAELLAEMNYYPTRFAERPAIYTGIHPRSPRLDLPVQSTSFDGIVLIDELAVRPSA